MTSLKKTRQKKKKRKISNTPEAQFQREWVRVQNFKKQNEQLKLRLDTLAETVRVQVHDSEVQRMERLYSLSVHLVGFVTRRTLPDYLRNELFGWINEHFTEMEHNPFIDMSDKLGQLNQIMHQQCAHLDAYEQEKYEKKLIKEGITLEEIDEAKQHIHESMEAVLNEPEDANDLFENEDMFADLFKEFAEEEEEEEDGFWEHLFDEETQHSEKSKEQELEQLLKATPVNTLFRRIAKKLHPDLEPDEQRKAEKHRLMSDLVHARDQKDISTIIQMYSTHVGELPDGFFEGNFEKLTNLLKYQLERLKSEKDDIFACAPQKAFIYEMFNGKNERAIQNNIAQFLRENEKRCASIVTAQAHITSVASLRLYLEDRCYMSY